VAVQALGGALPLTVALDERLERAHELFAVVPVAVVDRAQDGVAEQSQRGVVLQREQQLEGAELAVGRQTARRPRDPLAVAAVAVAPRRRREPTGLERAARLAVGAARLAGGRRPAGARG